MTEYRPWLSPPTREFPSEDTGRTRRQLCGLLDEDVEAAPAALSAVTRLVPVRRHIGWL
ncbi:hypothetical protein ABT224_15750 [Streptomyces sp. NPDC001584]|uniref:hypothetical protein n=1 Tax=Streptomyces sp. NPDC001584 TaxID=3154521 RepID=UPI00332C92C5